MSLRVIQIATGEGAEHENTTTENTILRKTWAPYELSVGSTYPFTCAINVNDENSTDTNTVAIRFGTTSATPASNTACGSSAAVDGVDNDFAVIIGFLEVQTSTRAVCYGFLSANDAANVEKACAFMKVLTIDRTVTNYLDVTIDFSVAHADNEIAAVAGCFMQAT